MKRVLILYGAYGGGHLSAAKTICKQIENQYKNEADVVMVDCIEYINKYVNKVSTEAYKELAKKVPLFMELGGTINFAKYKETEEQVIDMSDYGYSDVLTEAEASITQLGLKIPLNIVYCVKINDNVSIKPYTGFYVRVNLMAKEKAKLETTISNDLMNDIFYNLGSEAWAEFYSSLNFEEEVNCFDEDEIGREYVWNRAQVGWQIGASLDYKRINIGIGYALDFNEITEKTKCGIFSANIGVNF